MTWLKNFRHYLWLALLAFGVAMAAQAARREKQIAGKWADEAVKEKERDVVGSLHAYEAADGQRKLHENRAAEAKLKAEERAKLMGDDDEVADILDRLRKRSSGGVRIKPDA